MLTKLTLASALALAVLMAALGLGRQTPAARKIAAPAARTSGWSAVGTLLEACSCAVPCPCNFGQNPSRDYCHTVYAYRLKTARYAGVTLDGLVFGGGEADKGAMGFLDSRATPEQKPALEKLALAVFAQGGASAGARKFETVRIVATDDGKRFRLGFGGRGGFEAGILFGRDNKRPIIVENNTTWPVDRFIKGKTSQFDYQDALGNHIQLEGVNANIGEFHLSGEITLRDGATEK